MEQISIILEPYKQTIGNVASIVTGLQMLSGAALCNDIRKRNTTEGFSALPFLGGNVISVVFLKLGSLMADQAILMTNLFGFALNICYLTFFYFYTIGKAKNKLWLNIGISGAMAAAILAYAEYEDPNLVEFRLNVLMTVLLFGLIASPFLSLPEIIRNKSTEGLPFPMIVSGTVVSFMWLLYGFCLNNGVMVFQNVVFFGLSAVQLSLFAIYPSTTVASVRVKVKVAKSKKTKKMD